MIPSLIESLERLGIDRNFVAAIFATILVVLVLLAPSVARWFEKRNP